MGRLIARLLPAVMLVFCSSAPAVVLTGSVRSLGAEAILVPPALSSPVVLRFYVEDGATVNKGDPVLRIDAGAAAAQLQGLKDKIERANSKNAAELARLQLAELDAQIALVNARAAAKTAAVDAAIPAKLIAAIDYDRYQGTWTSAKRAVQVAERELADARAAVARQEKDGELTIRKLTLQLDFNQDQVDVATVYAGQDGTVVHGFIRGSEEGRYDQGSNARPGTEVGEIVKPGGHYAVEAWLLESDRDEVHVGQQVNLHFDALPSSSVKGTVTAISGVAQQRREWGGGRYFQLDIQGAHGMDALDLLPGMSVRVDTNLDAKVLEAAPVAREVLHASGEIYARSSVRITPPQIPGMWRMTITRMAGDGIEVSKGQPIVTFAAGDVAEELPSSKAKLKEQKRSLEKLELDLAQKAKEARVTLAEAEAEAEKARRKAQQPQQYVPGIEYKKLVIDRERAAGVLKLTRKRSTIAARYRQAQQQQATIEVRLAQHEVTRLTESVAKLTLNAPRSGILLHRSEWSGEKIDTGSSVWRGRAIADIPDMDTLAVHASLPEHDLTHVHVGQPVKVTLSGGISRQIDGRIHAIGRSVHSKSRAEPIPVIDLDISLDESAMQGLKPGQPVQVTIRPAEEQAT